MPGLIALVGSGEFTPALEPVDRTLLEDVVGQGRAAPARVVVVPTASAPDGETVFQRWGAMGRDHFTELGASVDVLEVRTREDAADPRVTAAVAAADLVYLSGGKPDFLYQTLVDTPMAGTIRTVWEGGAALAGCSAGAMVLADHRMSFNARIPMPTRWGPGLGLVTNLAVAPHYDRWPETMMAPLILRAPSGVTVLGIDEDTAAVGRDGRWLVQGPGRVTVWRGSHRERFGHGVSFEAAGAT